MWCKIKSMGFESDSFAGGARTRVKQSTYSQGHTDAGSKPERRCPEILHIGYFTCLTLILTLLAGLKS